MIRTLSTVQDVEVGFKKEKNFLILCGPRINAVMVITTEDFNQKENKRILYDELLQKIKNEHETKAKELIPQLCYALASEDLWLSKEDIRDRIKKDLVDIWSLRTITKYIPNEFKDEQMQDAGRKDKKKVTGSIAEAIQPNVLEQSINTNGNAETILEDHPKDELMRREKPKQYDVNVPLESKPDPLLVADQYEVEDLRRQLKELNLEVERLKLLSQRGIVLLDRRKIPHMQVAMFENNLRRANVFKLEWKDGYVTKIS